MNEKRQGEDKKRHEGREGGGGAMNKKDRGPRGGRPQIQLLRLVTQRAKTDGGRET